MELLKRYINYFAIQLVSLLVLCLSTSCGLIKEEDECASHCGNGVQDCGEQGIDCGAEDCLDCDDPCAGHCSNSTQDCEEEGLDCGGECQACDDPDPCASSCDNGKQDCGELGIDCGGPCAVACTGVLAYRGVSLAGADFGYDFLPGTHGTDYIYPTKEEVDYFMGKGMNFFRLPFRWERLQHTANGEFDADELERIDAFVQYALGKGAWVLLDPHNYARYYGQVIGDGVDVAAFCDFWARLAKHFTQDKVIYGLVNEPHTMSTELWLDDANQAIDAIRKTGAKNIIFVPGNAWSGAHSWNQDWYGTPNGQVMLGIKDPLNKIVFEAHQYLNSDSAGTEPTCVSPTIGSERLMVFTKWLRDNGYKGFLGEFNFGYNDTCNKGIDDMLTYLEDNNDVWTGWAYWAAGPWWGNHWGSIEPQNGVDDPKMAVLEKHLSSSSNPDNPDGCKQLTADATSDGSVTGDLYSWSDAKCQPRSAVLADYGVMTNLTYQVDGATRSCGKTGANGWEGFGYVVTHCLGQATQFTLGVNPTSTQQPLAGQQQQRQGHLDYPDGWSFQSHLGGARL